MSDEELDYEGLRNLQAVYDELTEERAKWIAKFDTLHDGDPRKAECLRQFDELGTKIRKVENQFDEVIDG